MTSTVHHPIAGASAHRIARSSMFWRLWWRAISIRRSQAALGLGALMVGAAIASLLLNLYGDVRRKMTEDFRAYGANVVMAPAAGANAGSAQRGEVLDQSALRPLAEFARHTPGTVFVPVLYGVLRASPEPANPRLPEFTNVVATGANFGTLGRLSPGWRQAGETVAGDLPAGECVVGANLAARMHLRPGDSLALHRVDSAAVDTGPACGSAQSDCAKPPQPPALELRIAAVLTTGASEDDQVFLPLAALQSFLGMTGKVTLVQVAIPGDTHEVESAIHGLAGALPALEVRPIRQIVYSAGRVLGTIRWLLLSLTVLILVIIALCVMATMTAIVLERRKDIGVMKALGAADDLLMRLFVAEGAGLGLVGGVVGYAMGVLLARRVAERLFGVALSMHAWTLPVVCGLTVALAVIAAQVPVRIVRAIQPTVVLKGE